MRVLAYEQKLEPTNFECVRKLANSEPIGSRKMERTKQHGNSVIPRMCTRLR